MPAIRRNDHSPRVEMLPLIDVVFLLLTFFIYAMIVRADILSIDMSPVAGAAVDAGTYHTVTVSVQGTYRFDREPVSRAVLIERLQAVGAKPERDQPPVFLTIEEAGKDAAGVVDRGPMVLELMGLARQAGVADFKVVGPKPR